MGASQKTELPRPCAARGGLWLAVALGWLAAFSLWFYHFELPNNPTISRPALWLVVPDLLLDLIDPPAAQDGSRWAHVAQRLDAYLLAGLIVAAAWGWGHLLLLLMRVPLPERCAERTVFAFGCGISLLTLATLGCGLTGGLSRTVLGSIVAVGVIGGVALRASAWWRWGAQLVTGRSRSRGDVPFTASSILKAACLAAMAPFVLAMLLGATLPPTDFDAKAYHVVGPKEWFLNGRISFLPHNVYTSFPFLTEMLTLLGMSLRDDWFRGALAGQAVLMSFAPFTALGLYAAGRRWFSPAAGWLAALVYLTTPWTYRISTIAYAEGGLSFFLAAALLAVAMAVERRAGEPPEAGERAGAGAGAGRIFLLAGVLAGSAMACKYTGLVQVMLPLGLAAIVGAWRHMAAGCQPAAVGPIGDVRAEKVAGSENAGGQNARRHAGRPSLRWLVPALLFAAGAALTIGPWLVKNVAQTGNPVYPLAYSVFGGRDWDAELEARFRAGHSSRPDQYSPSHLAAGVIDVAARNDWHSALLFGLAPLALLSRRRRAAGWLWLYVMYLFGAWWVLTHRIDRFWVPIIPVVALLAGIGATWCAHFVWKVACGVTIAAGVLFNLAFVSTALAGNNAWFDDLGRLQTRAAGTAPNIADLNKLYEAGRFPPEPRILLVGDAQVFDARFPHVYNTVFDRSIFEQWFGVRDPGSGDGWRLAAAATIRERLAAAGITHVAVNWQELLRYRTTYGYSEFVTPARFAGLVEMGVLGPPLTRLVSHARLDELPPQLRRHLSAWAPELEVAARDGRRYVSAQLYPVTRAGHRP